MRYFTLEQLRFIFKHSFDRRLAQLTKKELFEEYGIYTRDRYLMFLAQMAHESGGFRWYRELRSDTSAERKYGPHTKVGKQLGNTKPGDGAVFIGRGMIMLTGRGNYKYYGDKLGIDLINNPGLAGDPVVALQIAMEFWKARKLNDLADNRDFEKITRRVNGGLNGYEDRKKWLSKLTKLYDNNSMRG